MTPLAVRARIETLLRAQLAAAPESSSGAPTDPSAASAAALLSRMPRPRCGTPGCSGKLSRNTGKCGRCGGATMATAARPAHDRPVVERLDDDALYAQSIAFHGTSILAEQDDVEKIPVRHCNAALFQNAGPFDHAQEIR